MIDSELKRRVKFKQSIDGLNKCHPSGEVQFKLCQGQQYKPIPFQRIEHSLIGTMLHCNYCQSIIFKGNKQ